MSEVTLYRPLGLTDLYLGDAVLGGRWYHNPHEGHERLGRDAIGGFRSGEFVRRGGDFGERVVPRRL